MPRRLLSVLQSEGLFNDATALVVFQTAVLATVSGGAVSAPTLVLRFVLGVVGAVAIGVVVAFVARWITARGICPTPADTKGSAVVGAGAHGVSRRQRRRVIRRRAHEKGKINAFWGRVFRLV